MYVYRESSQMVALFIWTESSLKVQQDYLDEPINKNSPHSWVQARLLGHVVGIDAVTDLSKNSIKNSENLF